MKIAVPDVVSNSYFPAVAAVELGMFKKEGLEMSFEHIYPVVNAFEALRDGKVQFVAGSAHGVLTAFPEWRGAKLTAALAQGMYWFLVMRADIGAQRGKLDIVKGRRIGAAAVVDLGLKRLLAEAGISPEKDKVRIGPIEIATPNLSFGLAAAKALEDKKVDGFWANGMAAETAVRLGVGTIVLDVRRGDGPSGAFHYTMPCLITTDSVIEHEPAAVAAAVRAIVNTQRELKRDVRLATTVGRKVFGAKEAEMIADVVARDLPYYDPSISEQFVQRMTQFARDVGMLHQAVSYETVVASQFRYLWGP